MSVGWTRESLEVRRDLELIFHVFEDELVKHTLEMEMAKLVEDDTVREDTFVLGQKSLLKEEDEVVQKIADSHFSEFRENGIIISAKSLAVGNNFERYVLAPFPQEKFCPIFFINPAIYPQFSLFFCYFPPSL